MNYGKAICGLIAAAVLAEWAEAHHSAAAAFTNDIIEVEGTVTEFNFTNPHIDVYFDVTGEDGEVTQWRASGSAANLMRRRGWTAQTIQPGQYLRVTGREARNGVPMVLLGSLAELDPGDGSLVRNVEGESDYDEPVGAAPLALTLSDGSPNFTGAWTTTVETYRRMDDPDVGAALAMEMVITDPAYLTGPWTLRWRKFYTPGYEFIRVDCRVPPVYRPPE